jgi:hypothetical protein
MPDRQAFRVRLFSQICYREVVAEKIPDDKETLRITIKSDNVEAGIGRWSGSFTCYAHRERSDWTAQTVWISAGWSEKLEQTDRQHPGTAATAYLQAMTTQNRYIEAKLSKSTWPAD